MFKKIILIILLSNLLTSCITISVGTATPAPPQFVTATLPATQVATAHPTRTAVSETAAATDVAGGATKSTFCAYSAVLLEDVTIPDDTKVAPGEKFTKTWKFKNIGTCAWKDLTIIFASGDRMEAPDSAPVPETATGATVDISIDLVAPTISGEHTGNFSLKTSSGEIVPIGTEKTFWVKVIVGSGALLTPRPAGSIPSGSSTKTTGSKCNYSQNTPYVVQLADLINKARTDTKLPALTLNDPLTAAAQSHSIDMACNNFLDHQGSDGSGIYDRIVRAGFTPAYYLEIIAIGAPQNAIDQWSNDPEHLQVVLDPKVTLFGVGYAYNATSNFGGYFTVDLGK
jgi:uncharacterized protein YkwD